MHKFSIPLVILIILNISLFLYILSRDTSARIVFGPQNEITRFDKDQVLSQGDAQSLQPVIFQVPLDPAKLLVTILTLEAPLLGWLGFSTWRARIFSKRRRSVALIGEGGVGKSTLLQKYFMNRGRKERMTKKFQTYHVSRYKDGRQITIQFYDTVGQNMSDTVRRVLNGERDKRKVQDVMILLSIFPVARKENDWVVEFNAALQDLPNSEIVKRQKEKILNLEALSQFLMSLDVLEGITILFNQIDLIADKVDDVDEFCNCLFPEAGLILDELESRFYQIHGRSIKTPIRYISAENGTEFLPCSRSWRAFEPFSSVPERKKTEGISNPKTTVEVI